MMWSALEAYSNEALFCNYGQPQNYRQAVFGNSSVECYSFRSFFLSAALMKIIYHSFTVVTYYSAFGILVETKFSDSKFKAIQCVWSGLLLLISF